MGFNAKPSAKGPDSVRSGISYLQSLDIRIVPGSENIVKERRIYSWAEDKEGRPLPKPVKYKDHLMDAARMGIVTHLRDYVPAGIAVIQRDVRPD
jgi:phage terminase large subunit